MFLSVYLINLSILLLQNRYAVIGPMKKKNTSYLTNMLFPLFPCLAVLDIIIW